MLLNLTDEDFSFYLAGLWEGDGHLVLPSNKVKQGIFAITFHQNNNQLVNYIKAFIGFGFIRKKVRERALVLTITNKLGLLKVISLINGKLKTPKIFKFNLLIDLINLKYNLKIIKYDINNLAILDNYWLAGFSEADACFDIQLSSSKKKAKISFRYRLDQRMYDPNSKLSYFNCLSLISSTFFSRLCVRKRKAAEYYHITISSKLGIDLLLFYFNKFSLLGIKLLDFNCWKEGIYLYKTRTRINPELILKLKALKSKMNSRRVDFDLIHFK